MAGNISIIRAKLCVSGTPRCRVGDAIFTEATGGSWRRRERRRASGSEPVPTRAHLCVRVGSRSVARGARHAGSSEGARSPLLNHYRYTNKYWAPAGEIIFLHGHGAGSPLLNHYRYTNEYWACAGEIISLHGHGAGEGRPFFYPLLLLYTRG